MTHSQLTQPIIIKTLSQIQGVDYVLAHSACHSESLYSVVVFLDDDTTIDATLATADDLSDFADFVDSFVVGALDEKKAGKFNFRIILN